MTSIANTFSLKALLNKIKMQRGMTDEDIADAARLHGKTVRSKRKIVSDARTINKTISYDLADWILENTFAGENHFERAMNALEMAGLNGEQVARIRGMALDYIETNQRLETKHARPAAGPVLFVPQSPSLTELQAALDEANLLVSTAARNSPEAKLAASLATRLDHQVAVLKSQLQAKLPVIGVNSGASDVSAAGKTGSPP